MYGGFFCACLQYVNKFLRQIWYNTNEYIVKEVYFMIKKIVAVLMSAVMAVPLLTADVSAYTIIVKEDGLLEKVEVPEAVPEDAEELPFREWLEEQQYYGESCFDVVKRSSDSITLHWNRVEGAETVRLYKYNPKKKKYSALKSYLMIDFYLQTSDTVRKLEPSTKYQFMIRYFDAVGNEIEREILETSTTAAAPKMSVTDVGKSVKVQLKAAQKGYNNYEIYYLYDPYYEPIEDYYSEYDYNDLIKAGFRLFKRTSGDTVTIKLKQNKPYTLVARAYKVDSKGQKIYGSFTSGYNTFCAE